MLNPEAPVFQAPGNCAPSQPASTTVKDNSDVFQSPPDLVTQKTTVRDDRPRSITTRRDPNSSRTRPNKKSERRAISWPKCHPPFHNKYYDGVHPSKIPDLVWKKELVLLSGPDRLWLEVKDPFEGGVFDASRTPWWSHWLIAFAHTGMMMEGPDICEVYKWRYRDMIPGIENMTATDECELWVALQDGLHKYAFKWDIVEMRELWYILNDARKRL